MSSIKLVATKLLSCEAGVAELHACLSVSKHNTSLNSLYVTVHRLTVVSQCDGSWNTVGSGND